MVRQKKHFVDNDKLKEEFVKYRSTKEWEEFSQRKASGEKKVQAPPLPLYVAKAIMMIADNFALKPNWRHLGHIIEDMKSEAVLSCLKYAHNYDPNSGTSAFGYLTEGVKNGFLMKILNEKRQKQAAAAYLHGAAVGMIPCYDGEMPGRHTTVHAELLMKHQDDVGGLDRDMAKPVENTESEPRRQKKSRRRTTRGVLDL